MSNSPYTPKHLFEFAVLHHPPAEKGKTRETELIVEPTTVLARDNGHAQMLAVLAIPTSFADVLDRCEVVMRPF